MLRGGGEGDLRTDERGVTVQIGAVLLFGIVVVALATLQLTVVPDQNADVEFDHSRTVEGQLQDLRNGLLRTAATGDPHPTRVDLGTRYPDRVLFVNPPPASGTLRTVGTHDPRVNVSLEGGRVDAASENARDYWTNASDAGTYDTGTLVYRPGYSEYQNAPTVVYEHGLLLNQFDGGETLPLTGQTLVSGNTIDLVALRGSLAESRPGAYTVDPRPVSETETTVTVRSTESDPLVLAVTSQFPATTWESSILAGESAVADVSERRSWTADGVTYHRVAVEFAPGAYELRTGSVGVGTLTDDEATSDLAYLVAVDDYRTVGNETNGSMTVEVRDRFNNPASDAAVDVAVDADHLRVWNGTAWDDTATLRTGADGRATVRYRAINVTSSGESAWLNASVVGATETWKYRNYTDLAVPVVAVGSGNGDELNPGSSDDLVLDSAQQSGDAVTVSLENPLDQSVTVTAARLNFYYSAKDDPPTKTVLSANGTDRATLQVKGDWVSVDPPIELESGMNDPAFTLTFTNGQTFNNDFFVLTLVYEVDGERHRGTYFISPS